MAARSEDRLAALADSVGAAASYIAGDAAIPSDVAALEAFVRERHGVPEVVINCAGVGEWKRLQDTSMEELRQMIDAPYLAAANASRMFLGDMVERGRGTLIHVNSPACFVPWPSAVGYTASRYALRGLHEALLQDLAGTGVRSCHVIFGRIDSEYFEHNEIGEDRFPLINKTIPTLSVDECANVLADVSAEPEDLRVHPFMLRLYYRINLATPQLTRWLTRATTPSVDD